MTAQMMRGLIRLVESHTSDQWITASEDELREYAALVRGDNDDGSPAYFDPEEGSWRYEPEFPLSKFTHIMSAAKWRKWIKEEIASFIGQYGHDRGYTDMMTQEIVEPIVISIYEGQVHVWDGFHRIGISFAKGAKTIKAVVGTPPET